LTAISALTPALEDYLEAIYVLQKVKEMVKVVDIANHLQVTMPSVTGGIRRLAALEYVVYEKWHHVELTDKGERVARRVNRRHEELYTFYHEILGADKNLAEKSACKVEHVLEPCIIERITYLTRWMQSLPEDIKSGFSQQIQAHSETRSVKSALTLDKVKPGGKVVISRISAYGEIGQRLLDMGVTKGSEIEVIKVAPLGDPIDIRVKGYHLSLRKSEANKIEVKVEE